MMNYEYSLGSRVLAFLIDMFILGIISTFLISLGLGTVVEYLPELQIKTLNYWQEMLLYIIYFVGFAVFNNGITIGKMLLKLKVTGPGHEKLEQNRLIFREIIKCFLMPISFISFIIVLLKEDKKSIHDMIMNTYVVKPVKEVKDPYNLRQDKYKEMRKEDVLHEDYYEGINETSNNNEDYYE